ncbi:MAG TPA: ABC transporter permease [Chloroflexota bacterium]
MSLSTPGIELSAPLGAAAETARHFPRWPSPRRFPRLYIGGAGVLALLLIALLAPLLSPHDPIVGDVSQGLQAPSLTFPVGTDDQGRDILSRVIWGSRISLSVALISVSIGLIVGVSIGLVAGYAGGTTDLLLMRVIDALLAFPALLLAISITAALGPQIQNAMIAIGVVSIPLYARLTRAQVLSLREREFITAARAIGVRPVRIALSHLLPNMASSLIVQATLTTAFAILQEAVLAFLGLGAQPPTPSWGQDISYNQRYLTNLMWWGSVGPGFAIFLAVFAFNFLGDALRDWLDPRVRRRR